MSASQSKNKVLEKAIADALSSAEDFKEKILAINCAIKYEAVKLKMADQDFGSHFDTEDTEET
jgi:predicted transcriptional regulator